MTHKKPYTIYIASCDENGGIYSYNLTQNGTMELIDKIDLDYPKYMTIHNSILYAVLRSPFKNSEQSGLVSFDISKDGRLINKSEIQSTKGEEACHLSVDDEIYCVNYISGSVIKMPDKLVTHSGSSIHPTRQTSPHTHQVIFTPDKKYVCVTDLGLDKISLYDKNLNFVSSADVPEGHGPRHIEFSPDGNYAFCANELKSTVTVFRYFDSKLIAEDTYNALPADYQEETTIAAIRISADGKYLYVSNRGHDSISCFKVDKNKLSLFDIVNCGGNSPRDFNITPNGDYLICTNENSDNVATFKIFEGKLSIIDVKTKIKKPLCVIFNLNGEM